MDKIIGIVSTKSYFKYDKNGIIIYFTIQVDCKTSIFGEINVQYRSNTIDFFYPGDKIKTFGKIRILFGSFIEVTSVTKLSIYD